MNDYPTDYHVYSPDRGENLEHARVYQRCHGPEEAAERYAESLYKRDCEVEWPISVQVHCPETRSTVTVSVDRDWRPVFGARVREDAA